MKILEIKNRLIINHVFNKYNSEIEDIVEDTKQEINEKLKNNDIKIGCLQK